MNISLLVLKFNICIKGDCDNDDECSGSLVCGRNSCNTAFNTKVDANSKKFFPSGQADCCISKSRGKTQ